MITDANYIKIRQGQIKEHGPREPHRQVWTGNDKDIKSWGHVERVTSV